MKIQKILCSYCNISIKIMDACIKINLFYCLFLLKKITQDTISQIYLLITLQNNLELLLFYKKYCLYQGEINFIESMQISMD